jgi:DNA modification methylase
MNNIQNILFEESKPKPKITKKRANELDGKTWGRYSISIWSDIRKTSEEIALGHPALFPLALVKRLIECFTNNEDKNVLDPFSGVGSTVIAATLLGKKGIGIEIEPNFIDKTKQRLLQTSCDPKTLIPIPPTGSEIICGDAREALKQLETNSINFVCTSPPYWDILNQKRTADKKPIHNYGKNQFDLGKIESYDDFLSEMKTVFTEVFRVLMEGKYCVVVVMDIRKKDKFYPFHSDLARYLQEIGFIFDDIIIWDRRHEYNNMRPLGYPSTFRINKAHEFVLVFKKPSR